MQKAVEVGQVWQCVKKGRDHGGTPFAIVGFYGKWRARVENIRGAKLPRKIKLSRFEKDYELKTIETGNAIHEAAEAKAATPTSPPLFNGRAMADLEHAVQADTQQEKPADAPPQAEFTPPGSLQQAVPIEEEPTSA